MNKQQECDLCGHKWEARTEKPLQCPKCKRYNYDKKIEVEK